MGRFAPVYSNDQRWAITVGAVDRGLTANKTVKLAKAGELPGPDGQPLEPFEPRLGTVADYMSKERAKRRGLTWRQTAQGTPEQRLDALTEQSLKILEHQMSQLGQLSERRPLDNKELELLRKTQQTARETRALVRGIQPQKGSRPAKKDADPETPPSELAAGLLTELQKAATNGDSDTTSSSPSDVARGPSSAGAGPVPGHAPVAV